MQLPLESEDEVALFDLEVFNYYESWAWECWSHKDAADGDDAYLPIRHLKDSENVEVFVIGASKMGRAMVNFAMPLMNYGEDDKHCRITIFDTDRQKKGFLPDCETLNALPEVQVCFVEMDGCSDEANAIMLKAARKPKTSVTIVVALSDPETAIRIYFELSNRLRRESVSVLIWQATHSGNCPNKKYLKMGGSDAKLADQTTIRFFGMTDRLPWKNPDRLNYGMAINFYYDYWYGQKNASPKASEPDFVSMAKAIWNEEKDRLKTHVSVIRGYPNRERAAAIWVKEERWKKWASVNSGDSFREKSLIFAGRPYAEAAARMLKAEHNRWWTEKLLGGWLPDANLKPGAESHADKPHMIHGDMVPFEQLSEGVKDKDKINIAAMAACGFVGV